MSAKTGAQEKSRENEQNVQSLDSPNPAVGVVSGVRLDDCLAHREIGMVGMPPALKRASAMSTASPRRRPPTMDILPMSALPLRTCNDAETFGHRAVQRSLSETRVHGSRFIWFSEPPGPESGAT